MPIAKSAEAGSATSFARFDFAATFAIKHQYLEHSPHRGDRTYYCIGPWQSRQMGAEL